MNTLKNKGLGNCGPFSASVKMHQMMNKKISEAIEFASRASIYNAEVTAMELTTAQSILVSIMYSLLQNDMCFCVSLLNLAQSVDHRRSSYLPTWLKDDFNFHDEQVIQVISRIVLLSTSRLLIIPSYIENVFAGLASKYKVIQWCKTSDNTDVLHFLSGFCVGNNVQCRLNLISEPDFTIPSKKNQASALKTTEAKAFLKDLGNEKQAQPEEAEAKAVLEDLGNEKQAQPEELQEVWVECSDPVPMHLTSTTSVTATASSSSQGTSIASCISTIKEYLKVPDDFLEEDLISLITYSDMEGSTPLHNAVNEGDPYIVECMLGLGAKVDAADKFGYTPSHCAASTGSTPILQVLSQHQANLSMARHDGCTPLHEAIINGHADTSKWLLEHGSDINTRNEDGWSPLHLAAQWDQLEIVRLLIANGADTEMYNNNGKSPIDVAREEGNLSIVQLLSENTRT